MTRIDRDALFWTKVAIGEPDACWEWQAAIDPMGYGRFWDGYRMRLAHREMWARGAAALPANICLCHRCDNPKCCNPSHLFTGTRADNNRDMRAKGRSRGTFTHERMRGVNNHHALLNERQAREIKRRVATGVRGIGRQLAAEYGVTEFAISAIKRGKTWGWVTV